MTNPAYTIRNYRPGDFHRLIQLACEVEKLKGTFCCTSPQDFIEDLGKPHRFPENNLFIAEIAGSIMGYLDVMPELTIGQVVLNCLVHPRHRPRGLVRRIVECGIQRAGALGVNRARVNIPQNNATARRLFARMGFEVVRRFLELRLDLSVTDELKTKRIVSPCRRLRRGEEDKLTQLQNRSFSDAWGFNPNTVEEIVYRTRLPRCSPRDIIIAFDFDKPVGYCWTRTSERVDEDMNGCKGHIYMLGVDPDHRGKGVGKRVLIAGLSHLKGKGVRRVELTVDSANTAACALYRSVGFEVSAATLWYEKVLSQGLSDIR